MHCRSILLFAFLLGVGCCHADVFTGFWNGSSYNNPTGGPPNGVYQYWFYDDGTGKTTDVTSGDSYTSDYSYDSSTTPQQMTFTNIVEDGQALTGASLSIVYLYTGPGGETMMNLTSSYPGGSLPTSFNCSTCQNVVLTQLSTNPNGSGSARLTAATPLAMIASFIVAMLFRREP